MQLATSKENMNGIIFIISLVVILKTSSSVEGYPSSNNLFENQLTSRLLDELFEPQVVRRFDPAWRHIGLGKRSNKRQSSGTREQEADVHNGGVSTIPL